jgi:hypothetical protein
VVREVREVMNNEVQLMTGFFPILHPFHIFYPINVSQVYTYMHRFSLKKDITR